MGFRRALCEHLGFRRSSGRSNRSFMRFYQRFYAGCILYQSSQGVMEAPFLKTCFCTHQGSLYYKAHLDERLGSRLGGSKFERRLQTPTGLGIELK